MKNNDKIMIKVQKLIDNDDKNQLDKILDKLDDLYYNKSPKIDDTIYDTIVLLYEKKFGKRIKIGSKVKKGSKLSVWLGSINKKSTQKHIDNWKKKENLEKVDDFLLEGKADGMSVLIERINNKTKLFSRGDGKVGEDITRISKYLSIPQLKNGMKIRGEIVMKTNIWKEKYKNAGKYSNPRNLIPGAISSKKLNSSIISDLSIIAYEFIHPRGKGSEQIQRLQEIGFETVLTEKVSDISQKNLSKKLKEFSDSSEYDIDGIICLDDSKEHPINKSGNPSFAFAYKELREDHCSIVTVVGVEWNGATNKSLKPTIIYKPVKISGNTYRRSTGYNASFIEKNKIGKDSQLKIVISGMIIPNVHEVIKGTEADMPNKIHKKNSKYEYKGHGIIPYKWGEGGRESNLDIFALEERDDSSIKKISKFFNRKNGIDCKGMGEKTIEKLFKNGYTSVTSILKASKQDFLDVGFKDKTSENLYNSIRESLKEEYELSLIMSASQIFQNGISYRSSQKIIDKYPNIMNKTPSKLENVFGLGPETLEYFLKKLSDFKKFLNDNKEIKIKSSTSQNGKIKKFTGKLFVFTGKLSISRKDASKMVKEQGGNTSSSISRNVDYLILADPDIESKKSRDAKKYGIKILSEKEFLKLF